MYQVENKRQADTSIGQGKVHLNPSTGKPQGFKEKPCKHCGEMFKPNSPCNLYCCQTCADDGLVHGYLMRTYKITLEDWVCMFEKANGCCSICGSKGFKLNKDAILKLVVDHDHETGEVRGLLCHNCNRALGLLQDSKQSLLRAVEYLESSTTIPKGSTLK